MFVKSGLVVSAYLSSMCIMVTEEPFYMAPIAIFSDQKYYLYQKTWTCATTPPPTKFLYIVLFCIFVRSGLVVSAYLSSMCIVVIEEPFFGVPIARFRDHECDLYQKTWACSITPNPKIFPICPPLPKFPHVAQGQ